MSRSREAQRILGVLDYTHWRKTMSIVVMTDLDYRTTLDTLKDLEREGVVESPANYQRGVRNWRRRRLAG